MRTFLAGTGLSDIPEEWLKNAIEARGGRVLDSSLPAPEITTPVFEQSLRNQWMHWFFGDALALYPNDAVVTHHVERHGWMPVKPATSVHDPRVQRVVDALFAPVRADYELTARVLRSSEKVEGVSPKSIVRMHPAAHMPVVEDAFTLLTSSGVLRKQSDGSSTWGESAHQLHGLLQSWSTTRASA